MRSSQSRRRRGNKNVWRHLVVFYREGKNLGIKIKKKREKIDKKKGSFI
jgi:hypothetical protein